jgi:hypothetical protein
MATPEKTTREFSPAAQARRDRRAAKAARLREVALDSLDVGRGAWTGPGRAADVVDAGVELATKQATAAVEVGRPLRPTERRQLRRETLDAQAGKRPVGQASSKPSLRDRLERMAPSERYEVLNSIQGDRERAYVEGLVASIAEVEEEVEYKHATWLEEQQLAAYEEAEPSTYWPEDSAPLTEAERRAEADLAEETAGPLFQGDPEEVYSDNLEDDYDLEEEGGDEWA